MVQQRRLHRRKCQRLSIHRRVTVRFAAELQSSVFIPSPQIAGAIQADTWPLTERIRQQAGGCWSLRCNGVKPSSYSARLSARSRTACEQIAPSALQPKMIPEQPLLLTNPDYLRTAYPPDRPVSQLSRLAGIADLQLIPGAARWRRNIWCTADSCSIAGV